MASFSIAVLADDLTGAAELAAIGNRHGLPARIFSSTAVDAVGFAGLSVYDSDTRLCPPADAASRAAEISRGIAVQKPAFVYKKTDSVLRGNVVAESIALAEVLGRQRVLLVPANPSLGRTVSNGQYFVQGVPIHETAFARDPHHPAKSASVVDLLGAAPAWPVTVAKTGGPLPDHGIIVGEAATAADVKHWARRLDEHTLPAGGAEFFQNCLQELDLAYGCASLPATTGATLIVTGSLTPARETLLAYAASAGWPLHPMPASLASAAQGPDVFNLWIQSLAGSLQTKSIAVTTSPRVALDDATTGARIRRNFGELIQRLLAHGSISHLIVEGGATAAAISEASGWTSFDVAGEWAPGVIALRPVQNPAVLLTIKPGSYKWPESLWHELESCFSTKTP